MDKPPRMEIQGVQFEGYLGYLHIGSFIFGDEAVDDILTYINYYKAYKQQEGTWNGRD